MIRALLADPFPPAEPPPLERWRAALAAALSLAALVVALYWPAVNFRLLNFDDGDYTTKNVLIQGGLRGESIVRAFTTVPETNLYIPVTHLFLMADVELFGMSSRGFHLTNILIHAVSMAILLLVLWRMTGSLWKSVVATALVAFHPLRVESVAWVTERKGLLAFLFLLLTVACHLRYVRTGRRRWYGALFLCSILAMLSKPIVVTIPLLLLILDYWPLGRFRHHFSGGVGEEGALRGGTRRIASLVAEKLPLAMVLLLLTILTAYLQRLSFHERVPFLSRVEHSLSSLFIYLRQTAFPTDLAYRFSTTPWTEYSGTLLPAILATAAVTAAVLLFSRSRPYLAAGWGWYVTALLPVSGITPTGAQWISDRFTHIPHVGLAVAVVWTAASVPSPRMRRWFFAIGVITAIVLAILSRHQMYYWKDGATVFGEGMAYNGEDPAYAAQYVDELMTAGDLEAARVELARILPRAMEPGIGINIQLQHLALLDRMGDRKGAVAAAREYLRRDAGFWKTRLQLADSLLAEGSFGEAEGEYRRLLELTSMLDHYRAYMFQGLGIALSEQGRGEEALQVFSEGLRIDPGSVPLRFNTAIELAKLGDLAGARRMYEDGLRLDPANVRLLLSLGDLLHSSGDLASAALRYGEVARLAPGFAEGAFCRGRILEASGDAGEARRAYGEALSSPPMFPDTPEAVRKRLERLP